MNENGPGDAMDVPRDTSQILDLYKIAVDGADKVSARRGTANQYYLTLQTLIVGVPAVFGSSTPGAFDTTALSVIGIAVSAVWWLQLRSYRQLNSAKFSVINKIEGEHFAVRPFSDEWHSLARDRIKGWRDRYAELGTAEQVVPFVFALLHAYNVVRVWLL